MPIYYQLCSTFTRSICLPTGSLQVPRHGFGFGEEPDAYSNSFLKHLFCFSQRAPCKLTYVEVGLEKTQTYCLLYCSVLSPIFCCL